MNVYAQYEYHDFSSMDDLKTLKYPSVFRSIRKILLTFELGLLFLKTLKNRKRNKLAWKAERTSGRRRQMSMYKDTLDKIEISIEILENRMSSHWIQESIKRGVLRHEVESDEDATR